MVFTVMHKKKVEPKLRQTNRLKNLLFFFLFFWSPLSDAQPADNQPPTRPSLLCVCTAAISKSISCHYLFLLAQFYSLHLAQGDKLLPQPSGHAISGSLCRRFSLSRFLCSSLFPMQLWIFQWQPCANKL